MDQVLSNKMTSNRASDAFSRQRRDAQTLSVRLSANQTTLILSPLFKRLVVNAAAYINDGQRSFGESARNMNKRPREISEDDLLKALNDGLRKAGLNGYTDPVAALEEIKRIAVEVLESYVPGERHSIVASMVMDLFERFQTNAGLKLLTGACCFQERKVKFRPVACQCKECNFLIDVGSVCWVKDQEEGQITICSTCHKKRSFISVKLRMFERQNMANAEWVTFGYLKTDFRRSQLNASDKLEPTQKCIFCRSDHHTVCAMYDEFAWKTAFEYYGRDFNENFRAVYVCQHCMHTLGTPSSPNPALLFHPSNMATTRMSEGMENYLHQWIRKTHPEYDLEKNRIYIREVSSRKGTFEARPRMKEEFKKAGRPFKWEYKQRSIMLFQQLEGSEFPIVLFNLIVNEYPSTRTVSLSYIDSVKFFEPEDLRRNIFQRVILAYMDQARRIGYETLTIWVCPPNEGDEYVFYGRDETNSRYVRGINQGIIQWYSAILNAALTERIINDYDHPTDEKFPDYLQIPYMAEDFWPQQLEEILEAYRKQVEEHNASSRSAPKKRGGKASKKAGTASGSGGPLLSIQERVKQVTDNYETMEALYLVKLEPPNAETDFVNEEEEPDMLCSYMSNRDNFIMDCRGNDYDFFTSRRARFSTVKMCSRMAEEVSNRKCRHCEKSLTEGVYCFVCLDAAYCTDCAHVHEHSASMREFRVPFCLSKLRPIPVFRTILEILEREASWLTTVANVLYTPEGMQPYDINTKEQACILNYHHVMLHRRIPGHDERKQAHCRTCSAAYFPLQRHMEFCKGRACYVPSCGKDLLFDNAGRTRTLRK